MQSDPYARMQEPGNVPAVEIDMQPGSGKKSSKKGLMSSLLMTSEGPAESSAAVADEVPSQPVVSPSDKWWSQKPLVAIMLMDAGIFFVISLITFSIWNIVVSATGLVAGCLYYVYYFLHFRAMKAIKGFYWPGIIVGVAGSVSAVKDLVVMILKITDSPVGGSIAVPFRLIFIVLNGVMGFLALWVWMVGVRCKKLLEEEAAAAAAAGGTRGVLHRAQSWMEDMRSKVIGQGAKAAVTRTLTMNATPAATVPVV